MDPQKIKVLRWKQNNILKTEKESKWQDDKKYGVGVKRINKIEKDDKKKKKEREREKVVGKRKKQRRGEKGQKK